TPLGTAINARLTNPRQLIRHRPGPRHQRFHATRRHRPITLLRVRLLHPRALRPGRLQLLLLLLNRAEAGESSCRALLIISTSKDRASALRASHWLVRRPRTVLLSGPISVCDPA